MDVTPTIPRIPAVHTDILIVVVVAEVPVAQVFVDGVGDDVGGLGVACVAGLVRQVQLVGDSAEDVVVSAFLYERHVKVFLWDREVGPRRITDDCHTHSFSVLTQEGFVRDVQAALPVNAVTVVVNYFVFALLSAWVYIRIELVTVCSFPVIAPKGRNIRKRIVI